jgi:hypothetical protein
VEGGCIGRREGVWGRGEGLTEPWAIRHAAQGGTKQKDLMRNIVLENYDDIYGSRIKLHATLFK